MSTITRVGFAGNDGEVTGEAAAMAPVVDYMAEQMESLQMMLTQSDVSRSMVDEKLGVLADSVERLTHRMSETNPVNTALTRVAEGQERLIETLERQAEHAGDAGLDAESRMRLRSIDVQMLRILEEISAGRQETMTELRTDIAALSSAIRSLPRSSAPQRARGSTQSSRQTPPTQEG